MAIPRIDDARLGTVAWDALEDAYGPATEVPQLLRELSADEAKTRRRALSSLGDRIAHQGYATPAAVAVVPLLVALLEGEHPERAAIIRLLADLAVGGSHHHVVLGAMRYDELVQVPVVRQLREAMAPAESALRAVLAGEDDEERAAAALALVLGPWTVAPATLESALATASSAGPVASLVCCLGLAASQSGGSLGAVIEPRREAGSVWVRAAVGVAESLAGLRIRDREPLLEVLTKKSEPKGIAFGRGIVASVVAMAVMRDALVDEDLSVLTLLLAQVEGPAQVTIARRSLMLVLPPAVDGPQPLSALEPVQRKTVQTLARLGLYPWNDDYQRFGIPTRAWKESVTRYLAPRTQPLDRIVDGKPLWRHLWEVLAGRISGEAWLERIDHLDGAERIALCRDYYDRNSYRLYPWDNRLTTVWTDPATLGERCDRQVALWTKTFSGRVELGTLIDRLADPDRMNLELLGLLLALAQLPGGLEAIELTDALLGEAFYSQMPAPRCHRQLMRSLPLPLRRALIARLGFGWRTCFLDLAPTDELLRLHFDQWRAVDDRAAPLPDAWVAMGLGPIRERIEPLARALLRELEPPAPPRGRRGLEALLGLAPST